MTACRAWIAFCSSATPLKYGTRKPRRALSAYPRTPVSWSSSAVSSRCTWSAAGSSVAITRWRLSCRLSSAIPPATIAASENSSRLSRATPMIRLSGQRSAAPRAAAVRSATAPARPAPLAPLAAAGSEPAGLSWGLAGLSWGAAFTSVMVIRGRETEGQDSQVVVQISSVELADTVDHLVEQLLPGPVLGAEGLPDQVHQAFAAEPL